MDKVYYADDVALRKKGIEHKRKMLFMAVPFYLILFVVVRFPDIERSILIGIFMVTFMNIIEVVWYYWRGDRDFEYYKIFLHDNGLKIYSNSISKHFNIRWWASYDDLQKPRIIEHKTWLRWNDRCILRFDKISNDDYFEINLKNFRFEGESVDSLLSDVNDHLV